MSLYRRLLDLIRPYWVKLAFAMICMIFVSLLTAAQAFLVKPALDDVFLKNIEKMILLLLIANVDVFIHNRLFNQA